MDRLYWPVPIEDCSLWSDQELIETKRSFRNTPSAELWLNTKLHKSQYRVIPRTTIYRFEHTQALASHILWKVMRMEFLTAAILKNTSHIWHERYQLCDALHANGEDKYLPSDEDIKGYLLQGTPKPWNVPIGYVRDGVRIVLIRSGVVEDYLKRHLIKLFYDNGSLMADIDGEIKSITEHVGNHPTKTTSV